ncbi:unnamed protein product [Rotaria sp. Silwood2]|nr:unnamed protein product [Rotaria sp. Silwood2]
MLVIIFYGLLLLEALNASVLLYHTENGNPIQQYDCLFYKSDGATVKYCIHLNESIELTRNFTSCYNDGRSYTFSQLVELNITPIEILKWRSSMENVDLYSAFLNGAIISNRVICNCTLAFTFGKYCEYSFVITDSFEKEIQAQFGTKSIMYTQLYGDITCYTTLKCNYGLLCLDGRQICDKTQQCIDGLDEENCDKLEFNECDNYDEEYRCSNGMCIPSEYFLDGEYDCMDHTDESIIRFGQHCFKSPSFDCDERVCTSRQWSCGDGECLPSMYRFKFHNLMGQPMYCSSFRDINYFCEGNSFGLRMWTMSSGQCTNIPEAMDDLNFGQMSKSDTCLSLVKCALSGGLHKNCPCSSNNCTPIIQRLCNDKLLFYPKRPLIAPYVITLYDFNRSEWTTPTPDVLILTGSLKCPGYHSKSIKPIGIIFERRGAAGGSSFFELLFCSRNEPVVKRNESIFAPHYDLSCWSNTSKTFNNRPYNFHNLCFISHECFSTYRMQDGKVDCMAFEDERTYLPQKQTSCSNIEKYRFKCSQEEPKCLLPSILGNYDTLCENGRDEFIEEINFYLATLNCSKRNDFSCSLLKSYIKYSSLSLSLLNETSEFSSDSVILGDSSTKYKNIPFQDYCNTIWEKKSHIDELPEFCKNWICPEDYYQCLTNQCVPIAWVCDGRWDCSDASDEQKLLTIKEFSKHNLRILNLAEMQQKCFLHYRTQPFSMLCNISTEYPCLLANVSNPYNFTENRPCIKLSKIGDDVSDCYGDLDERNILANCYGRQKGYDFNCLTIENNLCITTANLCYSTRCLNEEDYTICSYLTKACHGDLYFSCINQTCLKDVRCNGKIDCEYGEDEYCDRITIITHLDLTYYSINDNTTIIKIVISFYFHEQLLDFHQFHVTPTAERGDNYIKHKFSFLYARTDAMIKNKQRRYFNRTDIKQNHPYSIRFEAYELTRNLTVELLNVWQYPIYFDYLPAFRFAKVLRLNQTNDSCVDTNRCGKNGFCHRLTNSNETYYCACKSGYYGVFCEYFDDRCSSFCSALSICKPQNFNKQALCICPLNHFGSTCHLKYNPCDELPCLNNGTCLTVHNYINIFEYKCLCPRKYYGKNCELEKFAVRIQFNITMTTKLSNIRAALIHYYDLTPKIFDLIIKEQQLFNKIPQISTFDHDQTLSPLLSIIRLYKEEYDPFMYLLYIRENEKIINITIDLSKENYCPHTRLLFELSKSEFNLSISVSKYHQLCQSRSILCFHDDNYFCICQANFYRAACFRYDSTADRCAHCLLQGRCVQGQLKSVSDFLCVCSRCYYGHLCQYSTEVFSFTVDSLIAHDIISSRKKISISIYVLISSLAFLLGFVNNICSFLTFKQPKPREYAAGNYLLILSIFNQCSLFILLVKIIHTVLNLNGNLFNTLLNLYMCKIISYLLSVLTRINYWLTSLITIHRLGLVLYPTKLSIKSPKYAFISATIVIFVLFVFHIHELFFYKLIDDPKQISATLCVPNYTPYQWSVYNRVNVMFHYLVPCTIQIITIVVLIIATARNKAKINTKHTQQKLIMNQLNINKELFITPIIILASALPQAILAFTYACKELVEPWQRYSLLTTYFLSYSPQVLGFLLFVLPSTMYKEEFYKTKLAQILSIK